jgi:hypothetical protein
MFKTATPIEEEQIKRNEGAAAAAEEERAAAAKEAHEQRVAQYREGIRGVQNDLYEDRRWRFKSNELKRADRTIEGGTQEQIDNARRGTKEGPGRARTRIGNDEKLLLAAQMPEILSRLAARRKSLKAHPRSQSRSTSRSPSESSKRRRRTMGGKKPRTRRKKPKTRRKKH